MQNLRPGACQLTAAQMPVIRTYASAVQWNRMVTASDDEKSMMTFFGRALKV